MNAEELRRKGDAAFTAKKFDEAIGLYTMASPALSPALFSLRAALASV